MRNSRNYLIFFVFIFLLSCNVNFIEDKIETSFYIRHYTKLSDKEMYLIDFIEEFYSNNHLYQYINQKYPVLFADTLSKYNRPDAKDIPQDINYEYFLKKKNKIKNTHPEEIKLCSYSFLKVYNEEYELIGRQLVALYKVSKKERLFFEFNSKFRDTTLILTDIRLDTFSTCNLKKYYKEKYPGD